MESSLQQSTTLDLQIGEDSIDNLSTIDQNDLLQPYIPNAVTPAHGPVTPAAGRGRGGGRGRGRGRGSGRELFSEREVLSSTPSSSRPMDCGPGTSDTLAPGPANESSSGGSSRTSQEQTVNLDSLNQSQIQNLLQQILAQQIPAA